MSSSVENERTSIGCRRSTVQRLEEIRPFESMSWNEFLQHLADVYEEHEAN